MSYLHRYARRDDISQSPLGSIKNKKIENLFIKYESLYSLIGIPYYGILNKYSIEGGTKLNLEFELCVHKLRIKSHQKGRFKNFKELKSEGKLGQDFQEYLEHRINTTTNLYLKSKYSDLIFELNIHNKELLKRNIDNFVVAVNHFFDDPQSSSIVRDSLKRLLSLALFSKNDSTIKKYFSFYIDFANKYYEKNDVNDYCDLIEFLMTLNKVIRDLINQELIENKLRKILDREYTPSQSSCKLNRRCLQNLMSLPKNKSNSNHTKIIAKEIGHQFVEEAEYVRRTRDHLTAGIFYSDAIQWYLKAGMNKEFIDKIKTNQRQINDFARENEFQKIPRREGIENSYINKIILSYEKTKIEDRLLKYSLDDGTFPSYTKIRNQIDSELFPLPFLPISEYPQKNGLIVKKIHTREAKLLNDSIIKLNLRTALFAHAIRNKIYELMIEKNPNFYDQIIEFINDDEIVSLERSKIIKKGIDEYMKNEYLISMHILTFQIEGILRDYLRSKGIDTFIFKNNESKELALGAITRKLGEHNYLSLDLLKYIESFLSEAVGTNLRNEIAHGTLRYDSYNKINNETLISILIKILGQIKENGT